MKKSKKQKTNQKKHKAKNIESGDSDIVLNNTFYLLESDNALDGANVITLDNIDSTTGPVAQLTTNVMEKGSQDINALVNYLWWILTSFSTGTLDDQAILNLVELVLVA